MDARIAALWTRIAGLSPAQQQALRVRAEAAGIDWSRVIAADAAPRPARLPLSPAQMHFWLGQQVHPESAAFSIAFAWDIAGPLDVAALRAAFDWLIARHEPLRTAFPVEDGKPFQQIGDLGFTLTVADVAPGQVTAAERAIAARPFDLAQAPLLRAKLLRIAPDRHRLLLSFHHIIADGWSRGVFMAELSAAYRAYQAGQAPDLPPLTQQFGDLVLARQDWLAGPEAAAQAAFWRQELDGLPPQDLPALSDGHGPDGAPDHRADTRLHRLDPALGARIAPVAARLGVTPFVLLLAVFQLLQSRLSGSEDVAVGTPVAGRGPDTAQMIGLFVNTLVLRARPRPGTAFRDWVAQVQTGFARAFAHQDLPFARVVDAMGAQRRAGRNPLFQALFQVQTGYASQNSGAVDLGDPALRVSQSLIPLPQTKFDLSWHVMDREDGWWIVAEYRRALWDGPQMDRLLAAFERLLASALTTPDAVIEGLDLLPAGDAAVLSDPARDSPDLMAGIRANAARSRVICLRTGRVLPGPDLLEGAAALARRLRAHPALSGGQPLAICLPRGLQMVQVLLAALLAGIPYVPLDPDHPADRRAMILADAGAALILDPAGLQGLLDSPDPGGDLPAVDPGALAYVIFTSGSTGRPKGVPVTRRALSNLIATMAETPGLAPDHRLLAITTIAFDIAALELLLPLAVGATLVLGDAQLGGAPDRLAQALSDHAITHLQATPATWRLLVDHGWAGSPLVALTGGEALPSDLGGALLDRGVALWNMYGPTETTIWSAARRVTPADLTGPTARIGDPVANTTLQVVDAHARPLPIGFPGQLAIGGAGLSPGYWRRPDLDAGRFADGLYLTGDRVRREPDGSLTFLGRLDHQIKLNGHRIEPGEIEAALRAQPGIADGVVMAQAGRLVAWCATDGQPTRDGLRAALGRALPAYMIPAEIVLMDRLPLNPNGKIDRGALPDPETRQTGAQLTDAPRAPLTEAERILLTIWSQVLGRDDLGVRDNFFAVGGASVSAMQIAARARAQGLALTPAQMFDCQTVAEQAAASTAARPSRLLPFSPWQAAMRAEPVPDHRLARPTGTATDAQLATAVRQVSDAYPVLRFALTPDGWQTDSATPGDLWDARLDDGTLHLRAHPLLLDAGSAARLADYLAALLAGGNAPRAGEDVYGRWLATPPQPLPDFAVLNPETDQPSDLTSPLPPVAPDDLAAGLGRVLAAWSGAPVTLALTGDPGLDALGHVTRILPLRMDARTTTADLRRAVAAGDPRGTDPRALPPGVPRLDWGGTLPATGDAVLHLTALPDTGRLVWRSRGLRPDTLSRLAARLAAELAGPDAVRAPQPPRGGGDKLALLRAKLTEVRG